MFQYKVIHNVLRALKKKTKQNKKPNSNAWEGLKCFLP